MSVYSEILKHMRPGDRSWLDAFERYIEADEAEKSRLRDPIAWIRKQLPLDDQPFPMHFLGDHPDFNAPGELKVRLETALPKRFRVDTTFDLRIWVDYPDEVIERLRGSIRELVNHVQGQATGATPAPRERPPPTFR